MLATVCFLSVLCEELRARAEFEHTVALMASKSLGAHSVAESERAAALERSRAYSRAQPRPLVACRHCGGDIGAAPEPPASPRRHSQTAHYMAQLRRDAGVPSHFKRQ